jgi:HD-like signal output (HDOD) protein
MNSTQTYPDPDKTGDALKAQRFQMLEDIAKELSGDVVFPTCFDIVLRLRKVLQDPNHSLQEVASLVSIEPLISAKLLHLANSVAYNPSGTEVKDLKAAINRLGINTVRSAALSIVMAQMLRAKGMSDYSEVTHELWQHSIKTAAAARVLAKTIPRINVDEAQLAGLIHDLGAFYMLYRATQYDELRHRPDTVKYLIIQWHESIGVTLLGALGMPEEIVNATLDHDQLRQPPVNMRNLGDIIYVANMLAGGHFEWLMQDGPNRPEQIKFLEEQFAHLKEDIDATTKDMHANFS